MWNKLFFNTGCLHSANCSDQLARATWWWLILQLTHRRHVCKLDFGRSFTSDNDVDIFIILIITTSAVVWFVYVHCIIDTCPPPPPGIYTPCWKNNVTHSVFKQKLEHFLSPDYSKRKTPSCSHFLHLSFVAQCHKLYPHIHIQVQSKHTTVPIHSRLLDNFHTVATGWI